MEREKDLAALQTGARLKIQISMLSEQLEKMQDDVNNFKRQLHRKEEETIRQQHKLRQIAIRQQLQAQVKRELNKREKNMVSIASVRGVALRHKTSLKNLTATQDEINKIVSNIESTDELWKNNISMQLDGNTKSTSMGLSIDNGTNNTTQSPFSSSPTHSIHSNSRYHRDRIQNHRLRHHRNRDDHDDGSHHKGFLSENDLIDTRSQHSLSSGNSMSRKSQSTCH